MVMERRSLEYFLAVAECGSISAAARQLGVSQPTVSAAIKRAEAAAGMPLLLRTPQGISLTDAGQRLLGPAAQVVRDFDQLDRVLDPLHRLDAGYLALVCVPTLVHDPVVRLVGRFRRRHPSVRVAVRRPFGAGDVEGVLASGRAEVGVGTAAAGGPELESCRLGTQRLVALVPPDAVVAESPEIEDLLALGLITTPHGGVVRQLLTDRLGASTIEAATRVETTHQGSFVPLVIAGLGVAFVSERQAAGVQSLGVQVRAPATELGHELWLLRRRRLSPAASAFVELALTGAGG